MHVFRWIIPFLFLSHDTRHKLERELLTWSFENARGIVACSLNLFKYQTLLIRILLNRNFYSFKIFSRAMSAGNFFSIFFFGGTCRDMFGGGGEGGGFYSCRSTPTCSECPIYVQVFFKNICVQLIYFALAADQQFLNRFCIYHTWI